MNSRPSSRLPAMPPDALPSSPGRTALVIVDAQNDFVDPRGALAVPGGPEILPPLAALMATARRRGDCVIATQDWHPAGHVSFSPTAGPPPQATSDPLSQRWPAHCVAGTWGADLAAGLDPAAIDHVVRKGFDRDRDSYSGFGGREFAGGIPGPGLAAILRAAHVTALDVAGLATEYCVRATVLDALATGFTVRVHRAAVRAVDPTAGDRALAEMATAGATIV